MTDDSQQNAEEAARLAKQAKGQGRAAAKNAGRAAQRGARVARAAAEPVVDAVVDEAQDTVEKLEGTAEDAVKTARRINPRVLSRISGDTGQGFIALSVALWAGTIAFNKFRGAYEGRSHVLQSVAKADHHIRPSE